MARPRKSFMERLLGGTIGVPMGPELGSTIDPDRIFLGGQINEVLSLDKDPMPSQLEAMIKHDGQARQLASALRLPVKSAGWSIEKGPNDSGEAQFVRDALTLPAFQGGMTTPFSQVLGQMSWAIVTRQAFFEKVWTRDSKGRFVYQKIAWRPSATCSILADPRNGSFNGFVQRGIAGTKSFEHVFKPQKAFVYIHGHELSPLLGSTAFETAYRDHLQKLKVKYLYYSFLENVAYPKLKATYTGNEAQGLRNLVKKAAGLSRGAVVGLGEREDLSVLESQRTSNEYEKALQYLDTQMSKSTLSTFLDLGTTDAQGSYALSKDQSEFFMESLTSILTEIAYHINNYLIPDLIFYNFGKDASFPQFKFSPVNDQAQGIAMDVFKSLATSATMNVGDGFWEELNLRAASILGLDDNKVIEDIPSTFKPETPDPTTPAPEGGDNRGVSKEEKAPISADKKLNTLQGRSQRTTSSDAVKGR